MFVYVLKCSSCDFLLPFTKFSKKNKSKRGYSYKCKECHNEYCREVWYKNNSEKQKQSSKLWKNSNKERVLAKKYKTTKDVIKKLFHQASNRCEICTKPVDICIDHCHETDIVRGILCRRCNLVLGLVEEDANLVSNLKKYIEVKC